MRLLHVSAVLALALAPVALTARAQDDANKVRPENHVYKGHTFDEKEEWILEIRFKDVSYRVSQDPAARKKVRDSALFLEPNANVIVYLSKEGVIVDIAKGQLKNQLELLPANLQKVINEAADDDEVMIETKGQTIGKVRKKTDEEIRILPAVKVSKPLVAGKQTYDKSGNDIGVKYKDIKKFVNLTVQAKQAAANGGAPQVANDTVSRQDLRVNDTVKIGFVYGQIHQLTPELLVLREWKGNNWGDLREYKRETLGDVRVAALELRRSYPVNGTGEVVVKEEKQREGRINLLTMRGAVWHDQKEFILVGAQLVFAAGPAGTNIEQTPAFKEEVPIPPVFGDEQWKKDRPLDQEEGQVTIYFDPAKNLIPARSREALPHIVSAFAAVDRDIQAVQRVYSAAALNGDPELAIMLVVRHGSMPAGAEQDRQQAAILEAIQQFGEKGAKAILEHVKVPDGSYSIPIPREDGTIGHKDAKDQAIFWKKHELRLLANIPNAAAAERGKQLFDLYEERSTELGEAILKVFQARTTESIDALLDVAVSSGGRPTADEAKRADDAGQVIRMLGDAAFVELVARVKATGAQGPVIAKQLQVAKEKEQLSELINKAIIVLVDAKRSERRAALNRTLEEAKTRIGAKDWEGGLKIVEEVLSRDRDLEDAKKLLYDCLVRVADARLVQKKRGEAASLLRRVIDDGQKGRGAEAMLARMLVESAQEDLDANCVRKEPDQASEVVKRCNKGDVFKIAAVKILADQWYPVLLSEKGDYGWIHRDSVEPSGDGRQCSVRNATMKPENVRASVEQIRKLSPERGADADAIDGELWIRDAKGKYDEGNYQAAYASFHKARELVPNDPALADAWKCWVFANAFLLMIFAAVIVVALVASILVLRNRQKRVKVGEFKYYGKDRVRVEREIDGASNPTGGEPAPAGEGAPAPAPADQPSDAAPPA